MPLSEQVNFEKTLWLPSILNDVNRLEEIKEDYKKPYMLGNEQ